VLNINVKGFTLGCIYTTRHADFADSAIDRGHFHRGRLSFNQFPLLPRDQVRDDRVEWKPRRTAFLSDQTRIARRSYQINPALRIVMIAQFIFSLGRTSELNPNIKLIPRGIGNILTFMTELIYNPLNNHKIIWCLYLKLFTKRTSYNPDVNIFRIAP